MTTLIIDDSTIQAKNFLAFITSLPFVKVEKSEEEEDKPMSSKVLNALNEREQGKSTRYKSFNDFKQAVDARSI